MASWRRYFRTQKLLFFLLSASVLCLVLARITSDSFGPRGRLNPLQEALAPFQKLLASGWREITSFFSYFAQVRRLQEENEQLRRRVQELTWENNRLKEYVYENQRLTRLLRFKTRHARRFELLGARVVGRAPGSWYRAVVVDRGRADGVRVNQVVVSDLGLVGRVVAVGEHTSEVLLILDREGAVGAIVQETRTIGVVEGSEAEPGLLRMIHLPYDAKLKRGQVVVTSGYGGIFPRGIPIGKILRVENEGSKLDNYALVQPYVDFNRLEEVFIITSVQEVPEPLLQESRKAR